MPALVAAVLAAAISITAQSQAPAPATPDALVAAAKRAAGRDYAGERSSAFASRRTISCGWRLATASPDAAAGPRVVPDRATWYARPYKVFDNLYFIGTRRSTPPGR